jgi:diacylglycerol kinase (ATP)
MNEKPRHRKGFTRIWFALIYSLNGLRFAFTKEAAFRQETCVYVLLMIVLYFLPISFVFKCILFFASTLVLIVELLNSAIESIVDIASPEYNDRAKQAKDLASAAVFVCIMLAVALWTRAVFLVLTGRG